MLGWLTRGKMAPNESIATIHWSDGSDDQISVFYEGGVYKNHDLNLAVAETETIRVEMYEWQGDGLPPQHVGDGLELRRDPEPLHYSAQIWAALKAQCEMSPGAHRQSMRKDSKGRLVSHHRQKGHWSDNLKIYAFLAGLAVFAILTLWSMKLGGDAIELLEQQIIKDYYEYREEHPHAPIIPKSEIQP